MKPQTQLKDAVRAAFHIIIPHMLREMTHRTWRVNILCTEDNGAHTNVAVRLITARHKAGKSLVNVFHLREHGCATVTAGINHEDQPPPRIVCREEEGCMICPAKMSHLPGGRLEISCLITIVA
ncbi:hypothetical protein PR048_002458 [Dryococelus australis]|uniref:Uncharacterized protein n=1 Tax=Dryococelus australis TaxID=614101 RepID=A0ABQ9IKZ8_9NEOP|nr:hypothetical protein PR048_002458 [Dryococelus australis]